MMLLLSQILGLDVPPSLPWICSQTDLLSLSDIISSKSFLLFGGHDFEEHLYTVTYA